MVAIEAHLINLILQLASMRQQIMPKIFQAFVNTMVQGTITAGKIVEWKKKHTPQHCENKGGAEDDDDKKKNPAHLGLRYWRSFLKCHPQITSKKAI